MMKKALRVYGRLEEGICILSLVTMTSIAFANVISRYVFFASFSFIEEITINCFCLFSLVGAAIAVRQKAHLGLSIFHDLLPAQIRRATTVFVYLVSTLICLLLTYYGLTTTIRNYHMGMLSPTLEWPQWMFNASVPLGMFMIAFRFFQQLCRSLGKDD